MDEERWQESLNARNTLAANQAIYAAWSATWTAEATDNTINIRQQSREDPPMTLKTPQDQQAVNARPTPQWDFAPEGALASSPQVGLGGAGGRALLSSILNTYVQKKKKQA